MPVINPSQPTQVSTTTLANQVVPSGRPLSTQSSFRQLVGALMEYNPDAPVNLCMKWINDSYRRVIDNRMWSGLLVKGQVQVPQAYTTGTVSLTNNSTTVTGGGTSWTTAMVGSQIRAGFSNPIYTITSVPSPTTLTTDLPWGGQNLNTVSYMIFQNIVSLGYNVKRVLAMVNQKQGYRLRLGMPQEVLNIYDTWRTQTGWTWMLASYAMSPAGEPQWELYPAPTFQQAFPFLAYAQPPDMANDNDAPVAFIRSDIILYGAIPHILRFRGKNSKYYDPDTANFYQQMYAVELNNMARVDDSHYPQDLMWEFNKYPFNQMGADFWQSHAGGDEFGGGF